MADIAGYQKDNVPGVGETVPAPLPATTGGPAASGGFFSSFGKMGLGPGMGGVQRPPMGPGPGAQTGTASPDDAMVQGATGNEMLNLSMPVQAQAQGPAQAAAPDPNVPPAPPSYVSSLPDGDKLWARYNELQKQYNDQLGRASYAPALENMPTYQPKEFNWKVFAGFAGIATIMAAALGKQSGAGLEGSMFALGAALKGYNDGHMAEAEQHRKDFYTQVNRTLHQNQKTLSEFDAVIKSSGNNMKLLEAQMVEVAQKNNMAIAIDAYQKGGLPEMMKSVEQMKRLDTGMFTTLVKTLGQLDKAKNLGTMEERDRQFAIPYSEMKKQGKPTTPEDDARYNWIVSKYGKDRTVTMGDGTTRTEPAQDFKAMGLYVPPNYKPPTVQNKALTEPEQQGLVRYGVVKRSNDAALSYFMPEGKMSSKDYANYSSGYYGTGIIESNSKFADAVTSLSTMIYEFSGKAINEDESKRFATSFMPSPLRGKAAVEAGLKRVTAITDDIGYLWENKRDPNAIKNFVDRVKSGAVKPGEVRKEGEKVPVATSPQSVLSAKIGTNMRDEKGNQFTVTEELKAKIRAAGVR